jgi:prephenate dehydrogenase
MSRPRLLIVGTGLIGTSIGLAGQGEYDVQLSDLDQDRVRAAADRGAGRPWDGGRVDLAVVAVPPRATAAMLAERAGIADALTHVASCQSQVEQDLEGYALDLGQICGGHPLAGREVTGPAGATAELFLGRPWVVCPLSATSAAARDAVSRLASACGAEPVVMGPDDHDRAVALSSHLPQLAASALAARLLDGRPGSVAVSGPGLQDTTRIAASNPDLWVDILAANAERVAPLVGALAADIGHLARALVALADDHTDARALLDVHDLLVRGNRGRALVPVKRGVHDQDVDVVAVRIPDRPGSLVALLTVAATAGINVEDVRVEHLPGRPTGVAELLVKSAHRDALTAALTADGLEVLGGGSSR